MLIELLGYAGLLLMVVSLLQNNLDILRKIGIVASIVFLIQAILLGSLSLAITNLFIISLHFYKLFHVKQSQGIK